MNAIDRMLIEHECKRLMVGYCVNADHDKADAFAELFARDGVWVQGSGKEIRGREALKRYIEDRKPGSLTRHVITNMAVDIETSGKATGIAYAIAARDGEWSGILPGTISGLTIVEYHDSFVHAEEGWRIARRETHVVMRQRNA